MRSFAWFMGLFAAGLAAIAVFTYPAWILVSPVLDAPFHRVGNRIGMLALAIGFLLVARHLRLADRASLGYALPRRAFLRESGLALVIGVVTMLPVIAAMIALDLRDLKAGTTLDLATLAPLAVEGLLRGIAVALIEETFLRGAMHTGIARESGANAAIVLTALLYAATHFIGRYRIPADQVDAGSGVEMLGGVLRLFADPLAIADAFLCLAAVGVLLGLIRKATGNIAACIGLHAGWVWVITFMRETSGRDESSPLAFLLSKFDGFVGWLVLAWIAVIGWGLYVFYGRRTSAQSHSPVARS